MAVIDNLLGTMWLSQGAYKVGSQLSGPRDTAYDRDLMNRAETEMLAVVDSSFQNEHMINSEKTTPDEAPGYEHVYSVVDRIMINFERSLEEKDGFVGLGSELATLFRRDKVPNEAEIRAALEGLDK